MISADSLVTGGGAAAILISVAYMGRLGLDWWRERRKGPSVVGDAATVNAMLVTSLEGLQKENGRLVARVAILEESARQKDSKISELKRELATKGRRD